MYKQEWKQVFIKLCRHVSKYPGCHTRYEHDTKKVISMLCGVVCMDASRWSRFAYKRTCAHIYILYMYTYRRWNVSNCHRMRALSLVSMGFQIFGGTCITVTKMLWQSRPNSPTLAGGSVALNEGIARNSVMAFGIIEVTAANVADELRRCCCCGLGFSALMQRLIFLLLTSTA